MAAVAVKKDHEATTASVQGRKGLAQVVGVTGFRRLSECHACCAENGARALKARSSVFEACCEQWRGMGRHRWGWGGWVWVWRRWRIVDESISAVGTVGTKVARKVGRTRLAIFTHAVAGRAHTGALDIVRGAGVEAEIDLARASRWPEWAWWRPWRRRWRRWWWRVDTC